MLELLGGLGGLASGGAALGGLFSSLFGGGNSTSGLEEAINRQNQLQQQAIENAQQQYENTKIGLSPYVAAGSANALPVYMQLLGLGNINPQSIAPELYRKNTPEMVEQYALTGQKPEGWTSVHNGWELLDAIRPYVQANAAPALNPTEFLQSTPGYQFQVQESENALNKALASKGMSLSGAGLKAAEANRQGLASQEYQRLLDRIAGVTTQGQNAATMTGSLGNQALSTATNALLTSGQQGVNSQYLLEQARNSSYNSPWGFAGYAGGKIGNALNQFSWPGSSNSLTMAHEYNV